MAYGVRGPTVHGTADVVTLVEHLFSSFANEDKTWVSHQASSRYLLQAVR